MTYRMQVVRLSENDCETRYIPVGQPVLVDADCVDEARCKAAAKRLEDRHDTTSIYHSWLVASAQGQKANFSPYRWAADQVQVV